MVTPELRSDVVDLVREAGRATMTYYDAPDTAGVREKADRSPVNQRTGAAVPVRGVGVATAVTGR